MSAASKPGIGIYPTPPDQRLGVKRTTRVRGLAEWQPHSATLALLDTVKAVLAEYAAYLPLTLRQVFYRLVGVHGYEKTEQAYSRLGEHLNRARRAGLIDFDAIRDDDANITTSTGWTGPLQLVRAWQAEASDFRLDRQSGQSRRLLIMVEARGMVPQIEAIAGPCGVPVIGSGGFDSLTAKYEMARSLGAHDGLTEILHLGDRDPSGEHLFASLADDVAALIRDLGLPGTVEFTRLAVTLEQIAALDLPTAPPKPTDRRSFDGETVQAEAVAPDAMGEIVETAILDRIDQGAFVAVLGRERRIRELLIDRIDFLADDDWTDDGSDGEAQP